jgi:hypothetical protein
MELEMIDLLLLAITAGLAVATFALAKLLERV